MLLPLFLPVHINSQYKLNSNKNHFIVTVNTFSSIALLTFVLSTIFFLKFFFINLMNMNKRVLSLEEQANINGLDLKWKVKLKNKQAKSVFILKSFVYSLVWLAFVTPVIKKCSSALYYMLIFATLFAMICWYVDVHNLQANPYWLTTKNINSLIIISTIIKFFLFFRPGFLKQEKKRVCSIFIFYSAWLLYKIKPWISLHDFDTQSKTQGRSEGTSSVPFEVLIINCQIYFITP